MRRVLIAIVLLYIVACAIACTYCIVKVVTDPTRDYSPETPEQPDQPASAPKD